MICRELLSQNKEMYYFQNVRKIDEVDFVICDNNKPVQLVQACYNLSDQETQKREIGSLLRSGKKLSCQKLQVIVPTVPNSPISKEIEMETEKSVEPKPSINPEELEKAKKHLSELYSPESATIDVGANIPEKFSNIEIAKEENPPEQVKPIDIDKSIPIEKEKPQNVYTKDILEKLKYFFQV